MASTGLESLVNGGRIWPGEPARSKAHEGRLIPAIPRNQDHCPNPARLDQPLEPEIDPESGFWPWDHFKRTSDRSLANLGGSPNVRDDVGPFRAVSFSLWARQRGLAPERSEVPVPFVWPRVTRSTSKWGLAPGRVQPEPVPISRADREQNNRAGGLQSLVGSALRTVFSDESGCPKSSGTRDLQVEPRSAKRTLQDLAILLNNPVGPLTGALSFDKNWRVVIGSRSARSSGG
jgi:hypothetical protein